MAANNAESKPGNEPESRPVYDASSVLPADSKFGASVLPAEMDDELDGLYEEIASSSEQPS